MSILIDRNTRVMTQGITGKTGQFHTQMSRAYANGRACFVAGVNRPRANFFFARCKIRAQSEQMIRRANQRADA